MNVTKNSGKNWTNPELFSRALEALKRGEVIVFPTETFYGLGADALDPSAVERLLLVKGRDPNNPIPIIVADLAMLRSVVHGLPPIAKKLIDRFWPGPLTLVLRAVSGLPPPLLNRSGGVGVRISSHPVATRLARELDRPLTATSANPSGMKPARTLEEAMNYFSGKVEVFLDGGRLPGAKGSTVLEIVSDGWRVVREGEISSVEIRKTLEENRRGV